MRRFPASREMVVAAVTVAAVLAGCGGGGSAKSVTAPTTVADDRQASSPSRDGGQFCDLIRAYTERFAGISQASSSPAQIRSSAQDLGSAIKAAIAAAPSDIKADVTVVAGAADEYLGALQAAGYDLAKLRPDAAQGFQAPDVAAAAGRLQVYSQNVCGMRS